MARKTGKQKARKAAAKKERRQQKRQQKQQKQQRQKVKKLQRQISVAEEKKENLEQRIKEERNIKMAKMHLRTIDDESARIALSTTKQAWQGVDKPDGRMRAIYDVFRDEIEDEYNGNISEFLDAKISERKDIINAAYAKDYDYLEGIGWSDKELDALSNAHGREEIYKLMKDLGYYA